MLRTCWVGSLSGTVQTKRVRAPALKYLLFFSFLSGQVYNGNTLFSAYTDDPDDEEHYSNLINNDGIILRSWSHERGAASMPYLLQDSTLIYPYRVMSPSMSNGGVGGGLSLYDWDGALLWSYEIADDIYQHHHDVHPMPNGNILVLAWERHLSTQGEGSVYYGGEGRGWSEMGRTSVQNPLNQLWSEAIFEIEPVGTNGANIVWEWHLWDHLVQDADPALPDHGDVSEHPELMDINYGGAGVGGHPHGDWIHFNAIDHNPELDQIVLSSRNNSEIYIIDHSTTTEEAAGHTGGNSGMGGDLLYRWGNPQVYGQGDSSEQQLSEEHGVNWIPAGYPGGGNLILYNNNYEWEQSAVFELVTPLNQDGTYDISMDGTYGPEGPVWMYTGEFFSLIQSGAFRLPNGNTLITVASQAYIFEVDADHDIVWDYQFPGGQMIARAQKYSLEYLGNDRSVHDPESMDIELYGNYPNPFNPATSIRFSVPASGSVNVSVYDLTGDQVATILDQSLLFGAHTVNWNARQHPSGVYILRIGSGRHARTQKVMLLK